MLDNNIEKTDHRRIERKHEHIFGLMVGGGEESLPELVC